MSLTLTDARKIGAETTENLVRRAQAGDAEAFEQLYRNHVPRVYSLCMRLLADVGQAELLTQDVFVRVWERLRSFRGESAFATWVYRITVNEIFGDLRSAGRRAKKWILMEDLASLDTPARLSHPGVGLDLERAVAGLPAGARAVFVLHDVEGYTHEEIAELTGLAVGTSKSQLSRARKLLREALA